LIAAFAGPGEGLSRATEAMAPYPWHLTFLADLMVRRLQDLDPEASKVVMTAAKLHPISWRRSLRIEIEDAAGHSRVAAGYLLEHVGDQSDVRRLRTANFRRSAGAVDFGRTWHEHSRRMSCRRPWSNFEAVGESDPRSIIPPVLYPTGIPADAIICRVPETRSLMPWPDLTRA
jgi:hypothetical protein